MQISREQLVQVLRTEGDNDTADKVEGDLPEQIDTDRDGDALAAAGVVVEDGADGATWRLAD